MRTLVTVIESEIAQVAPAGKLQLAWNEFVELLALGPAPELRTCPACQRVGMRAASRCMYCWSALAPLPALPPIDAPPIATPPIAAPPIAAPAVAAGG